MNTGYGVIYYQTAHSEGQWTVKHLLDTCVVVRDETDTLYEYFVDTNWWNRDRHLL